MKKKNLPDLEDDYDEEEDEEEEEDEDEEEEEEVKPKRKTKKTSKQPEEKEEEIDENWLIQHIPETFRVIDPKTKEVVADGASIDELRLKLQVIATQNSVEAAKNTR